jgi:hypothetical protein
MTSRVQALEQKAGTDKPRKIHLISRTPYSTSEEAVAAFKRDNPGTQDDEFIVMVGLSALNARDSD